MKFTSKDGTRTATVDIDHHAERGWLVTYTTPSGLTCSRPFSTKSAAWSWARAYVE